MGRRLRLDATIHPQFGTCWRHGFIYCQAKAKKPSADDGLGHQTRSFALVPVILTGGSGL